MPGLVQSFPACKALCLMKVFQTLELVKIEDIKLIIGKILEEECNEDLSEPIASLYQKEINQTVKCCFILTFIQVLIHFYDVSFKLLQIDDILDERNIIIKYLNSDLATSYEKPEVFKAV